MRLLLDSCMGSGSIESLKAAGHDVVWVGSWPFDPGDREILRSAVLERRVLVTLDRDFGALMFEQRLPHGGVSTSET